MRKIILFLLFSILLAPTVLAEESLVEKHSPILYFSQRENFFPVDVGYFLAYSELKAIELDGVKLVDKNPTVEEVSKISGWNYFLDQKLNSSELAADYEKKKDSIGYTVYYSVKRDGSYTVIQYWFFYTYNKGQVNEHEGDLEFIEVVLDSNKIPLFSAYSQHILGESLEWEGLDKDGSHPKVYVSLGSHANYFKPYQGNLGLESDIVEDNGLILKPIDYKLVNLDDPKEKWINFGGRWGDSSKLGFAESAEKGASGPKTGERSEPWNSPVLWADKTLRVNGLWFFGNWLIENFYYIFGLIIFAVSTKRIISLRKRGLDITPLKKLLIKKHSVGLFCVIVGTLVALVALISPLYFVSINIGSGEYATDGTINIIKIDGIGGAEINTLQEKKGGVSLFGLGLPITLLVIAGLIFSALDIIFLTDTRRLARKHIIGAIYPLLPLILIIVFISLIPGIIPSFSSFANGQEASPELSNIVGRISESPLMGQYIFTVPYLGKVDLFWGIGLGAYLFLLSALLKIAGGIILRKHDSN